MKKDGGDDDDSGGKHLAFGTIFDARLTLKYLHDRGVDRPPRRTFAVRFIPFGIGEAIYWGDQRPAQRARGKDAPRGAHSRRRRRDRQALLARSAKRRVVESQMLPFLENYGEVCTKQFPVIAEPCGRGNGQAQRRDSRALPRPGEPSGRTRDRTARAKARASAAVSLGPATPNRRPTSSRRRFDLFGIGDDSSSATPTTCSAPTASVQIPGGRSVPIPATTATAPAPTSAAIRCRSSAASSGTKVEQSQWTRATYPYVRGWRKPIREWFAGVLMISRAGTWYSPLDQSLHGRQSRISTASAPTAGRRINASWRCSSCRVRRKIGKGREPWTTDGKQGRADVHADGLRPSRCTPTARRRHLRFRAQRRHGRLLASHRSTTPTGRASQASTTASVRYQPELGWDTLNWDAGRQCASLSSFSQGDDADMRIMPPPIPFIMFTKADGTSRA